MRINGTEQNFSEKKLYVMIVIFRALCHTDNSNEGRCALLSQDSDGRSWRKTQPCLAAACWSTHNILTGATQGLGQIANSTCAPGQISAPCVCCCCWPLSVEIAYLSLISLEGIFVSCRLSSACSPGQPRRSRKGRYVHGLAKMNCKLIAGLLTCIWDF